MGRKRVVTGSVGKHRGLPVARVRLWTSDGRQHDLRVRCEKRAAAIDLRDQLVTLIHELGPDRYVELREQVSDPYSPAAVRAAHRSAAASGGRDSVPTLGQLADHYRAEYLQPPELREGKVFAGLKSWKAAGAHVKVIEAHFSRELPLTYLTFESVRSFKLARLRTPIKRGPKGKELQRSFADVHRTLGILRRMIRVAIRQRWMTFNPFEEASSSRDRLIKPSDEKKRDRILAPDEEQKILRKLASRVVDDEMHALIIALLDTGARVGEFIPTIAGAPRRKGTAPERSIRKGKEARPRESEEEYERRVHERETLLKIYPRVRWCDVDLASGTIRVHASKTESARPAPITPRLKIALQKLRRRTGDDPVFNVSYSRVRSAWYAACDAAGVERIGLHQLRHTRATRWIQGGLSESEVAFLLGHSPRSSVTRRYINPDERTLARALEADTRFGREQTKRENKPLSVN